MTVEDVCRLAWDYQTMRTRSAHELIARTRYHDWWRSITAAMLADTLRAHPRWTDAWILWSEDKRGGSGWYIVRCDDAAFDVGCHPSVPPVRYDDRTRACAAFVRNELASIAGVGPVPD